MDRRTFIVNCCKAGIGALILPSFLQGCGGIHYAANAVSNNKIVVKRTEFIETKKDGSSIPRKFVVIRTEKFNFPICVYKLDADTFSALLMECTHKSCELTPHGDYLICPCHGSEFNKSGQVQNPPAETDLQKFIVTTDHENIYIQL